MNIARFTLGILLAGAFAANASAKPLAQDDTKKSFTVADGGKLTIDSDRGNIEVKTGSSGKVEIEVIRKVEHGSEAAAQELLEKHTLSSNQSGNDVSVKAELPGKMSWGWNKPQLEVKYIISIPSKYNVDLSTGGGDVSINELDGEGRYHTSGGNLRIGKGTGVIFARTSGGDITVGGCGKSVDVQTSGGNLKLGDIAGDAKASTSGGDIHIHNVAGNTDAHTSGGNIQADDLSGTVVASTSGGNVKARLAKQPTAKCVFKTSGGNIDIGLASAIAADLDARTSGGGVHVSFPVVVEGKKVEDKLKTKLNGGGPALVMETSGGDIHISQF